VARDADRCYGDVDVITDVSRSEITVISFSSWRTVAVFSPA